MNISGKGYFQHGHKLSKGRPRKHDIIKILEELRDEVNSIPDTLLKALALKEPATLKQSEIPLSQVTLKITVIASGLLFQRGHRDY